MEKRTKKTLRWTIVGSLLTTVLIVAASANLIVRRLICNALDEVQAEHPELTMDYGRVHVLLGPGRLAVTDVHFASRPETDTLRKEDVKKDSSGNRVGGRCF